MEHSYPYLWTLAEHAAAGWARHALSLLGYVFLIAAGACGVAFLVVRTHLARVAAAVIFAAMAVSWFTVKEVRHRAQDVSDAQRLQAMGHISILMRDYDVVYASHRSGKVMLRETEDGGTVRLVGLRYAVQHAQDATLQRRVSGAGVGRR